MLLGWGQKCHSCHIWLTAQLCGWLELGKLLLWPHLLAIGMLLMCSKKKVKSYPLKGRGKKGKGSSLKKLPILLLCSVLHGSTHLLSHLACILLSPYCSCYRWALIEREMSKIILRIPFKDFTVKCSELWEIHTGSLWEEKRVSTQKITLNTGFSSLAFLYLGGNLRVPCLFILHSFSSTPGHSVPLLTNCVMLGKSGDCSVKQFFIGRWKWPLKPFDCMICTGI